MINNRYGRLKVIERAEAPDYVKDKKSVYYLCECDCGNKKVIKKYSLTSGITKSCGCYRKETQSKKAKAQATHGMTGNRFYRIWIGMKGRCEDPKANQYHNYGGKGIIVCERWQEFNNFMEDMYQSYLDFEETHGKDTASIDRRDSNGNYEPDNCEWATQLEQARNRGNNLSVEIDGKIYTTLSQVAEEFGLNYQTVVQRYHAGKRGDNLIKQTNQSERPKSKAKSRKTVEIEVCGVVYNSLTALQKAYPYISLVSISKRYKKGIRGAELVRCPKTKAIPTE